MWSCVHYKTIWHRVLPASIPPSGALFVLFKLLVFQDLFGKSPEQPGLTLWLTLLWAGCCTRDFLRSPSDRVILWSQTEGRVGWQAHIMQLNSPSSPKQWSLAHCLLRTASFLFYFLYSIQTVFGGVLVFMLEHEQHELQCGSMKPHALEPLLVLQIWLVWTAKLQCTATRLPIH